MLDSAIYSASGRRLDELCIEALRTSELAAGDFRISAQTLIRQAKMAEAGGYRQLAANLRRAAELTLLPNEQVLEIYDTLRPGRATHHQLVELATELETNLGASATASLVREAAEVYKERGILRPDVP